jgi:ketosteroid isomerase-like protein
MRPLLLLSALALLSACAPTPVTAPAAPPEADPAAATAAIRAVLDTQVADWNAGRIRDYMNGYAHTDSMTFLSGGTVRRGWEEALYAYVRNYPDRASMGTLSFSDLDIQPLSNDHALVWGRWRLARDGSAPGGLFTLLFARTDRQGWRIVHDHTSSE